MLLACSGRRASSLVFARGHCGIRAPRRSRQAARRRAYLGPERAWPVHSCAGRIPWAISHRHTLAALALGSQLVGPVICHGVFAGRLK